MDAIAVEISVNQELHVILDHYSAHKKCGAWLTAHPKVHPLYANLSLLTQPS